MALRDQFRWENDSKKNIMRCVTEKTTFFLLEFNTLSTENTKLPTNESEISSNNILSFGLIIWQ